MTFAHIHLFTQHQGVQSPPCPCLKTPQPLPTQFISLWLATTNSAWQSRFFTASGRAQRGADLPAAAVSGLKTGVLLVWQSKDMPCLFLLLVLGGESGNSGASPEIILCLCSCLGSSNTPFSTDFRPQNLRIKRLSSGR